MKRLGMALLGIIGLTYLLFPSLGIFELLPDSIPFIGNIDEAGALFMIMASLSYFGIKLPGGFRIIKEDKKSKNV